MRLRWLTPLALLVGCAVQIEETPVDRGPWDASAVTTLAILATSGQVVLDGSGARDELRLSDSTTLTSSTLADGSLTLISEGDVQLVGPADLEWSVATTSGGLSVSGMAGSGFVVTETGEVSCAGLSGELSVQVQEAAPVGVHLDLLPSGGVVIVESMVGPIALDLPADTSATLVASTSSGRVDITGVDYSGVLLESSADGVLRDGDGSIRLVTGTGDISVIGYGP